MAFAHFDIDLDKTGCNSTVKMDGVDITHTVKGIRVSCGVGEITTVSVDFLGTVAGTIESELGGSLIDITSLGQTWRILEKVK